MVVHKVLHHSCDADPGWGCAEALPRDLADVALHALMVMNRKTGILCAADITAGVRSLQNLDSSQVGFLALHRCHTVPANSRGYNVHSDSVQPRV